MIVQKLSNMSYTAKEIGTTLKQARERKRLSQRALSKLIGLPQAQISKIENGAADLKLSSLIKLTRALDLELSFVPRKTLPAVNAVIRNITRQQRVGVPPEVFAHYIALVQKKLARDPERADYAQVGRYLRELEHLAPVLDEDTWRKIDPRDFDLWFTMKNDQGKTKDLILELKHLRNMAAHSVAVDQLSDEVKPAYSLDENNNA